MFKLEIASDSIFEDDLKDKKAQVLFNCFDLTQLYIIKFDKWECVKAKKTPKYLH